MSRTPQENLIAVLQYHLDGLHIERGGVTSADAIAVFDALIADAEAALAHAQALITASNLNDIKARCKRAAESLRKFADALTNLQAALEKKP